MHEVFLIRLVHHPIMKEEQSLQIFLEYDKDVSYCVVPVRVSSAVAHNSTLESTAEHVLIARVVCVFVIL